MARGVLQYKQRAGSKFAMDCLFDRNSYPVRYILDSDDAVIRRNDGKYKEPSWYIEAGEEILKPDISNDGSRIVDDYLVLSCVPNLLTDSAEEFIGAHKALNDFLCRPDMASDLASSPDLRRQRKALKAATDVPFKKAFVVGGLHGPGTGAAKLLFSDVSKMGRLRDMLMERNLHGKCWQAVVHVEKVGVRNGRDVPLEVGDDIRVFPVSF